MNTTWATYARECSGSPLAPSFLLTAPFRNAMAQQDALNSIAAELSKLAAGMEQLRVQNAQETAHRATMARRIENLDQRMRARRPSSQEMAQAYSPQLSQWHVRKNGR